MTEIKRISGGIAKDGRGQVRFVNEFDMSLVKRFYIIKNVDTELIRGWRGHRIEQRWFYTLSGSFAIDLVRIDDWKTPSRNLSIQKEILRSGDMNLLHVPAGYATAFKALEPESEILVYADYAVSHALLDDYTWPADYFYKIE